MPEISIIIVNWNGKHFLETCLEALRQQTFRDFESILVDNGSADGSIEYVRDQFPEIRVMPLDSNVGFAAANNAGYAQCSGALIVLLNNDTEAHPSWLEEIHKASTKFLSASSFACKMMYFDDRARLDNCGFGLTSAGLTMDLGRDQLDGPAWSEPRKVFGACGGAAVYRRKMLEDVGLFDPDFFMTYEDVDLSFRGQLRGHECVFVAQAVVYHHYRATMAKYPAKQTFFSQRNIELVYLKNMPFSLILRSLPQRLLYELGGAVYFSKKGVGTAYFKAKVEVLKILPSILKKRRSLQTGRKISSSHLLSIMVRENWLSEKLKKLCSAWRDPSRRAVRNAHLPS
jgi:hypothetical protein